MHGTGGFLRDLAIVLCTAAVTTVLFQRLRLPVVLGYVLAGMIVGPHIPIPLVADPQTVETLAELGVVLLMFSIGLEFSLRKLARVGGPALLIAAIEVSAMLWLGYLVARQFGWSQTEALFTAGALAISSTTIIAKAFGEQSVTPALRQLVFSVLIVEDLIAILLLAGLTTMQGGVSAGALALTGGRLAAFLVGLTVLGMLVVPRTMRAVVRLGRPETTTVASIGVCFACALAAQLFGYSVALGAFIAGSLIADSGVVAKVEALVQPVRDMFAAIFFVAVGMLIDPPLIAEHWFAIGVLTLVVVVGKLAGVSLGAFLAGRSIRGSVETGMSMAQIGEFSFLIAALGLSLGATRDFLYPVIVAVSGVTTLLTPLLIKASQPVGVWIDRRAPRSLVTFEALYATWLEKLKPKPGPRRVWSRRRGLSLWIALDTLVLVAIVIGVSLMLPRLVELSSGEFGFAEGVARWLVLLGAALACAPFAAGLAVQARRLALSWTTEVFAPVSPGGLDLAAAPRRALTGALQFAILLAAGLPALAVVQPFVPVFSSLGVLLVVLIVLAAVFWRAVVNLQGHVRAGSQVVAEALAREVRHDAQPDLHEATALLPGLGSLTPVQVQAGQSAVGRTLEQLDLHARAGATVVCIVRDNRGVLSPKDDERVQAGDWIALTGTATAVERARDWLGRRAQ